MSRQSHGQAGAQATKLRDFMGLSHRRRPGSGLASSLRRVAVAVLLTVCCGGCLVTDKIVFPTDPDIPPTILDEPGTATPIGSIFWIDKTSTPEFGLKVRVRDQNVGQALRAHWRVVKEGDSSPLFDTAEIPPAAGEPNRDLEFTVQSDGLQPGKCHHLELAVSGSFLDPKDRRADDPRFFDFTSNIDDLALASWWVWEGTGGAQTDKTRLLDSCHAIEALLKPSVPAMGP